MKKEKEIYYILLKSSGDGWDSESRPIIGTVEKKFKKLNLLIKELKKYNQSYEDDGEYWKVRVVNPSYVLGVPMTMDFTVKEFLNKYSNSIQYIME